MSLEANRAVARRWIEEAWNQGNVDVADELVHPEHTFHGHGDPHRHHPDYDPAMADAFHGPEGRKPVITAYRNAFPDVQFTVDHQIAEGDLVVTSMTVRRTHQGEFMGMPPTGKQVEVHGIGIARIVDGKIRQEWLAWNSLSMLHQLGAKVVPPQSAES